LKERSKLVLHNGFFDTISLTVNRLQKLSYIRRIFLIVLAEQILKLEEQIELLVKVKPNQT